MIITLYYSAAVAGVLFGYDPAILLVKLTIVLSIFDMICNSEYLYEKRPPAFSFYVQCLHAALVISLVGKGHFMLSGIYFGLAFMTFLKRFNYYKGWG